MRAEKRRRSLNQNNLVGYLVIMNHSMWINFPLLTRHHRTNPAKINASQSCFCAAWIMLWRCLDRAEIRTFGSPRLPQEGRVASDASQNLIKTGWNSNAKVCAKTQLLALIIMVINTSHFLDNSYSSSLNSNITWNHDAHHALCPLCK